MRRQLAILCLEDAYARQREVCEENAWKKAKKRVISLQELELFEQSPQEKKNPDKTMNLKKAEKVEEEKIKEQNSAKPDFAAPIRAIHQSDRYLDST